MHQNLTEAHDRARAADEAKTSFLANMSHEIRTPMNGVIGFTELALSEAEDPAQRRRLGMIADSGNAMLRLLNDLLDFAKIEARRASRPESFRSSPSRPTPMPAISANAAQPGCRTIWRSRCGSRI